MLTNSVIHTESLPCLVHRLLGVPSEILCTMPLSACEGGYYSSEVHFKALF